MTTLPTQFGSKWEENMYRALLARKVEFRYQVPELGGWERGGTIIDFVITDPGYFQPIALFVDGARWHRANDGKAVEDQLKRHRLEEKGYSVKAVGDESETYEGALAWVKKNL
jgi:hypothetical protein